MYLDKFHQIFPQKSSLYTLLTIFTLEKTVNTVEYFHGQLSSASTTPLYPCLSSNVISISMTSYIFDIICKMPFCQTFLHLHKFGILGYFMLSAVRDGIYLNMYIYVCIHVWVYMQDRGSFKISRRIFFRDIGDKTVENKTSEGKFLSARGKEKVIF